MDLNSSALDYFREHLTDAPSLIIEGLSDAPKALLLKIIQESKKKNILQQRFLEVAVGCCLYLYEPGGLTSRMI